MSLACVHLHYTELCDNIMLPGEETRETHGTGQGEFRYFAIYFQTLSRD